MFSKLRFGAGYDDHDYGSISVHWVIVAIFVGMAWTGVSTSDAQQINTSATHSTYIAYPLKNIAASKLEPVLREMLGPWHQSTRLVVDPQSNQILLHAPTEAHRVAERLIRDADHRPPDGLTQRAEHSSRPAQDPCELKTYRIRSGSPSNILSQLRWNNATNPSIRMAVNDESMQLFVLAPASVHEELGKDTNLELISSRPSDRSKSPSPANPDPANPDPVVLQEGVATNQPRVWPAPNQSQWVPLDRSGADEVAKKLCELVGSQLRVAPHSDASVGFYTWHMDDGDRVTILFDPNSDTATITGMTEKAQQVARLLRVLDGRQPPGSSIRVLRVRRTVPALLDMPDQGSSQDRPEAEMNGEPNRNDQSRSAPTLDGLLFHAKEEAIRSSDPGRTGVYPAAFQDVDVVEPPVDVDESAQESADIESRLLRQLGLDVDIEVLPDLDVLILRGRDQDLDQVTEIIREIERIAKENKPRIEIARLKHIRSGALAGLIQDVQRPLLQGRPGRVAVISLETPNALLLIGWGEAIEIMIGLIEKLDEPIAPSAEMRIFRLRHASATVAGQLVNQFLSNRQGLGPEVRVIADPRSNALVVHAAPRDMVAVARLVEELDVAETASVEQVRIFELSHALATDLATTIQQAILAVRGGATGKASNLEFLTIDTEGERIVKSGLLDDVRITPNQQTNTLLVTGPANSMDLIAALIEQLDAPIATAQIKVFRVVNGDANSLVLMLRSLLPSQAGATSRPQLAGAEAESSLAPLRFSVERRTNSIIATGSAGDLRIIEALLLRLDENDMQRRTNTVYRLKNAPATDVARVINDFLRSEQRLLDLVPGELNPFEQVESEVIVVPEPVSNALIVSATPRFFRDIMDLIEQLDSQPPQVMIQVLIAEVGLGDIDEFGVELGLQDSILFDRSMLGELITTTSTITGSTPSGIVTSTNDIIQSATNTPGFLFNNTGPLGNSGSNLALAGSDDVGTQGISNFGVGRINNELGFGGLVLSASSESISILIRALQENRHMEILSRPQVMTLDNQPAFIQVGQRVPRVTETQLTNYGQVNTVEMEDVGLILGVTPRINTEGMVVMEIDAEKSEVGAEAEGIPIAFDRDGNVVRSPKIDITVASTTVSAASGETIVLGGLIVKRNKDLSRRVPLLADIPLLGDLFRYDLTEEQRVELLIILTPQVILGPADKERIKEIESARMSWCAANVHALHGDGGFCHDPDCPMCRTGVPIIYPDTNPRGILDENSKNTIHGKNRLENNRPYPDHPNEPLPAPSMDSDRIIQPEPIDSNGIQPVIPMPDELNQPINPASYGSSPPDPSGWPVSLQRLPAAKDGANTSDKITSSPLVNGKSKRSWSWPKWLGGKD
ncbi:MAG: hypothetical protein JW829_20740 [Pirellulales bacterium]|nr:hypothetical protein [Pirellulales bacterium]